jgi:hypothetical protein
MNSIRFELMDNFLFPFRDTPGENAFEYKKTRSLLDECVPVCRAN